MKKNKTIALLLAAAFSLGIFSMGIKSIYVRETQCVAQAEKGDISVSAKSAMLMEYGTGEVMYQKEANKRLPIASMCKIMTLLLSFEAIDKGVLSMEDLIAVSENAAAMGGSQVFLEANAKYPVKELIKSIVVCSANDSCVAMAEIIAGSEEAFVNRMNERAKELGCENTLFANCTGLPKEPQYSSAKDVAQMLRALLSHEDYFAFAKIWMDKFEHPKGRYTEISNTNRLVRFYDGCDGGKTGFTNQAGFCLAATAKRGNMRVISVVIGEENSKQRFEDVKTTFDYAFANYSLKTVVESSKPWGKGVPVIAGKKENACVVPMRNGYIFGKKGEEEAFSVEDCLYGEVKAPALAGEIVGEIKVYLEGVQIDSIPLILGENCEKASLFDGFKKIADSWNFS